MKKIVYLLGVTICTTIITFSCSQQNDLAKPQPDGAKLKTSQQYTICHHDTDSTYIIITVNENSLPGHMGHGDSFYWDFPAVGVYQWVYTLIDEEGNTQQHSLTLYITDVDDESFEGYGTDDLYGSFTIVGGTILDDGSASFTIDYDANGVPDFDVVGSYECGEGINGTIEGGGYTGTWSATWGGGSPEESGVTEVSP